MITPDPEYLKHEQYKDLTRLQARARLHSEYNQNPYGWFEWLFDRYELPPNARILEIGAGAGWLWMKNAERIPQGWVITLSDFSSGMIAEQQRNLSSIKHPFEFEEIDAQAIPHHDQTYDAVIANHMLYHVPDRIKAIHELRRVLKADGKLYTATNGDHHLQEIHQLMAKLNVQPNEYLGGFVSVRGYTLESAEEQLKTAFDHVEMQRYEDTIRLTEVKPLIDYIHSYPIQFSSEREQNVRDLVEAEIREHGFFSITKDMGVLIASGSAITPS